MCECIIRILGRATLVINMIGTVSTWGSAGEALFLSLVFTSLISLKLLEECALVYRS